MSSVFGFVDRLAFLVSDEEDGHLARLADVVASAFESLRIDLQPIVELLRAAERGVQAPRAIPESSRSPFFTPQGR